MKPWERRAVLAMDRAYLSACAAKAADEAEGGEDLTMEAYEKMVAGGRSVAERMFDRFGEVRDA